MLVVRPKRTELARLICRALARGLVPAPQPLAPSVVALQRRLGSPPASPRSPVYPPRLHACDCASGSCTKRDTFATTSHRDRPLRARSPGRGPGPQPLASGARAHRHLRAGRRGHLRGARLARSPDRPPLDARRPARHAFDRPSAHRPLEVAGATPGDALELEVVGYETDDFAWTAIWPGSGFLGDLFDRPFLARWELDGAHARSEQLPGVAVAACVHAGTSASRPRGSCSSVLARARPPPARRTLRTPSSPGRRRPPTACAPTRRARTAATWTSATSARARGCRPARPRAGRALSVGDLHFAQGDGEVCISAVETGGSATFRSA